MKKDVKYERDVLSRIRREIRKGVFGLDSKHVKTRHRPKYYSPDRGKKITFDVSVEVYRQSATEPYWIWILECKNYGSNVPVDDAEEFHGKLEQVGEHKIKGTIVARRGFDSGTLSYSKSKGIGLWTFNPRGEIVYVIQADEIKNRAIVAVLVDPQFPAFFAGLSTNGQPTLWWEGNIQEELKAMIPPEQ